MVYCFAVSNQMSLDNKVSGDVEFVDVDSVDADHGYDGTTTGKAGEIDDAMVSPSESEQCKSAVLVQKRILADHGSRRFCKDQDTTTSGCVETNNESLQLNHETAEYIFHKEDQTVDAMVSDSEEMMSNSSNADLISDYAENNVYFDGCTSDPCSGSQETPNGEITVHPDLFMLQDIYIWEAEMRFSSDSIQVTGINACGGDAAWFEWSIDNIVSIKAQWHARVQTAVVCIHVLSGDSSAPDPSVIQEIKFTVSETDWVKEQENIISLNDKYKPLCVWNDGQTVNERLYYPEFKESFDELVYPKDDSDPVTISKRDIDLLQPETFINDTIIDFYVKYLKDRLEPEKAHRFHFFNSFFFRKLADIERSHFDASEGRTSFLRVRKWTRKVNLFEKDYIFIPVNSNLHWSLLVICNPGEIAKFEDNNVNGKRKVPCILHMDSIKGSHTGLKNHVQSYLWEEWKEKQNKATEEISSKFFNLRFISLEVPQQQNSYDCGLFLLHYVELFLEEAPESFNPFHITKYSNFLNTDWFTPGDVSLKRAHIQRIIYYMNMNMNCIDTQQRYPPESNDQIGHQKFPEPNNVSEGDLELLRVRSIPQESCSGVLLHEASQDAERSTFGSPSVRNHLFADDSTMDLMEFHNQRTAGGLPDVADRDFNLKSSNSQSKSYIASVEENARNDDHFLYSLANGGEFTAQSDQVSFQAEHYKMQNPWSALTPTQAAIEATEDFECSRSFSHESEDLVITGVVGDSQMNDVMAPFQEDRENHHVGSSYLIENTDNLSETTGCPSPMVVEAASIKMQDNCCQQIDTCNTTTDNPNEATHFSDEEQNGEIWVEDNENADINMLQPDDMPVSKRARVEAPDEVKYLTRSIAEDLLS
ncbi:hypothetical protein QQ045_031769 [Rhodiola kirilowii]